MYYYYKQNILIMYTIIVYTTVLCPKTINTDTFLLENSSLNNSFFLNYFNKTKLYFYFFNNFSRNEISKNDNSNKYQNCWYYKIQNATRNHSR